jgi:hypothetical protein
LDVLKFNSVLTPSAHNEQVHLDPGYSTQKSTRRLRLCNIEPLPEGCATNHDTDGVLAQERSGWTLPWGLAFSLCCVQLLGSEAITSRKKERCGGEGPIRGRGTDDGLWGERSIGTTWVAGKGVMFYWSRQSTNMVRTVFHHRRRAREGDGSAQNTRVVKIITDKRDGIGTEGPCQKRLITSGQIGCQWLWGPLGLLEWVSEGVLGDQGESMKEEHADLSKAIADVRILSLTRGHCEWQCAWNERSLPQAGWHTPAISALGRLRQKNHKYKASLGFLRTCLQKKMVGKRQYGLGAAMVSA